MTSKLTNNLISWDKYLLLLTLLVLAIVPVWGRLVAAPITIIQPCSDFPEDCKFNTATDIPVSPTYAQRIAARFKLDDGNETYYCGCARAWYDTAVKIQDSVRAAGIDFKFDKFEINNQYYVIGSGLIGTTRHGIAIGYLSSGECYNFPESFYDGTYDNTSMGTGDTEFQLKTYYSILAYWPARNGATLPSGYELLGSTVPCCTGVDLETNGVPVSMVTGATCPMALNTTSATPWSAYDRSASYPNYNRMFEKVTPLNSTGPNSLSHCEAIVETNVLEFPI